MDGVEMQHRLKEERRGRYVESPPPHPSISTSTPPSLTSFSLSRSAPVPRREAAEANLLPAAAACNK